ncbi:MAG TPA: hypothetical protein VK871_13820 [Candidatus Limnocylindrales bacterium]|nr:hypothetical protein [Candidatus Limnocylindrales bacterium]
MIHARRSPTRRWLAAIAGVALVATVAGSTLAAPGGNGNAGFKTTVPAMLIPGADAPAGVVIDPIISVGDQLNDGFVFDSLADGISFTTSGVGRADLYVNHETSLVPFPGNLTDFTNAHVDRLVMNQHSGGILSGSDAIPSDANYQRFCSNFLAGAAEGFDRRILFTNEEATDTVNRTGLAWPAIPAVGSDPEQAGVVVALDIKSGEYKSIYGMGRHNHENSVAIPGFDDLVVLSGDDTFTAPSSQVYSYIASDTDALWNDEGELWAFVGEDGYNDYGDLTDGDDITGHFIPVPRNVAVGDQNGLEAWSNANNVFQFIRIEDIAYDRTDSNVVYLADTGEPRAIPDPATGRLMRGPSGTMGPYPNGRIFRMVLDEDDPTQVDSLSILINPDPLGPGVPGALHNPDNLETTANSLLIQEDTGSHNQFNLGAGPGARVWKYDLATGALDAVLEVDQSLDEDPAYDVGGFVARAGGWESSGIVDASSIWGPGWFLLDVQAGSLILESEPGFLGPNAVVFEREGGQLLRAYIPGA